MPSKPKTPIATLAVVEQQPAGPRARHTIPVWPTSDVAEVTARAETLRARYEAETGNTVVVNTHGSLVSA